LHYGKSVNNYGQKLLQLRIAAGLCICNGRINNDAGNGCCTCYTDCSPSLIDYILSDMSLSDNVLDFDHENQIESIHIPFTLRLSGPCNLKILFLNTT
jgi:hypothetical protein